MRPAELKELIKQDESAYLEYKSKIDLASKAGKAKFLKEVLSLANSLQRRAYLVIGVEDKKKTILGIAGVSEEQIQGVIKEWCRPVIDFQFEIVPIDGKKVGVMTIYSSRPPHTVKKKFGYPEYSKTGKHIKQNHLEEHEVFVRRGSTIEIASPEEIVEMAQRDTDGLDAVVSRLDRIADWQEEMTQAIYHLSRNNNDYRDTWFAIPILIGLLSGALLGYWFDAWPKEFIPAIPGAVSLLIFSLYGIFSGSGMTFPKILKSIVLLTFAFWGAGKIMPDIFGLYLPIIRLFITSFSGAIIGLVIAVITVFD